MTRVGKDISSNEDATDELSSVETCIVTNFHIFYLPSHCLQEYKKMLFATVSVIFLESKFLESCNYTSLMSDWPLVLK